MQIALPLCYKSNRNEKTLDIILEKHTKHLSLVIQQHLLQKLDQEPHPN